MNQLQKFYFHSVNTDNKKISGSIFAETELMAREKMRKQGLALFSIEAFDQDKAKTKDGLNSFEFEGTNADGKHVRGEIEAINAYEAYKKLKSGYEFEITSLAERDLDFEEKGRVIARGIPEEFEKLYKEESAGFKKKKKKKKKIEIVEISDKDKKELAFYHQEIYLLSREIKSLIAKSDKYLNQIERKEILQRLGLIERLRQSSAIDHLKNLTNRLINQLADDKLFMGEKLLSAAEKEEINNLRGEFKNYSKTKKKSLAKKIMEMNLAFNIDTKKLAMSVSRARPITQVGFVLYWAIASLFVLMTILWIRNGIPVFFDSKNLVESLYIFKSTLLWLITVLSLINTMVFAPMIFNKNTFSVKSRIIYFSIALILNIAVILFLPRLF